MAHARLARGWNAFTDSNALEDSIHSGRLNMLAGESPVNVESRIGCFQVVVGDASHEGGSPAESPVSVWNVLRMNVRNIAHLTIFDHS